MTLENIGRYEILEELGRGGMATVYRAKDPNFDREVAIKVLPNEFLHDSQFRVRFEREAKTIAALEHASIVPVYDFGEEHGMPYIVMRLMSGTSLEQKLEDGTLSIEQATQITTRIAQGLDAAHARKIIHRDLKPGNILFDQYGNAFLSDFGIARIAQSTATLTGGSILGTPAYMSPEQIQGEEDIDHRSDIYSLGILFYQMLSGHAPYQATTPAKVMMMHILEPVPNILSVKPEVPPAVEAVLEKALAKNPNDRYDTAGAFAQDLNRAVTGELIAGFGADRTVLGGSPINQKNDPGATIVGRQPFSQSEISPAAVPKTGKGQSEVVSKPKRKSSWLPIALVLIIGAVIIGGTAIWLVFTGMQGNGPLAMLAQPTPTLYAVLVPATSTSTDIPPTNTPLPLPTETEQVAEVILIDEEPTQVPATNTAEPTATITSTPEPQIPVEGGADKIAFLDRNDIWVVNLDGTDLEQLSSDGAEKTDLRWSPDGSVVTYISGKCIWTIDYESKSRQQIACFETGDLKSFSPSPDNQYVAISLSNELFVVPFDTEALAAARFRTDLIAMSDCEILTPLMTGNNTSVPVKLIEWSEDGTKLAVLIIGVDGGKQVDLIRLLDTSSCSYTPPKIAEFPAAFFKMENYDKTPYIQNFTYDGYFLFVLNSYTRNDGYGHMYIFNTETFNPSQKVNPVDETCCYRDTRFSPDGRYIVFAYQPYEAGAKAQLYYISFGSIGTGMHYEPIPLPDSFFEDTKVKPMPALRPVQTGQ